MLSPLFYTIMPFSLPMIICCMSSTGAFSHRVAALQCNDTLSSSVTRTCVATGGGYCAVKYPHPLDDISTMPSLYCLPASHFYICNRTDTNIFCCSAQDFCNGNLLAAGGHGDEGLGTPTATQETEESTRESSSLFKNRFSYNYVAINCIVTFVHVKLD